MASDLISCMMTYSFLIKPALKMMINRKKIPSSLAHSAGGINSLIRLPRALEARLRAKDSPKNDLKRSAA